MMGPMSGDIEALWARAAPMLASGPPDPIVPPSGPQWRFEVKWDGVRALALVHRDGAVRLRSRNRVDLNGRYPTAASAEVGRAMAPLVAPAILDGECVALDPAGRPSFPGAIRGGHEVRFVCFDVLAWRGRDVTVAGLESRRALVEEVDMEGRTAGAWLVPEQFTDGPGLFRATSEQGLEGVIAKRRESRYEQGVRSSAWVKLPHRRTVSLVVVGWVTAASGRGVASLVVADADGRLVGSVGSGMTERLSAALRPVLEEIRRTDADPVVVIDAARNAWLSRFGERLRWVDPLLVVDVRILGRTESGGIRQPVLDRMRPDLDAADLIRRRP
jgi:bifunctional non-homologous end joining protein LigD